MAAIQKRGKYWHARIRRRGYPTVCRSFDTRPQAEAWARQTESEIDRGEWQDRSEIERTTLSEALDRYVREISPRKKGSGELNETYKAAVIKRHMIAKMSLARIKSADLAKYRDERLKEVTPATVRLELALLSHLYTIASQEWGMAIANPVQQIAKPSTKQQERARRLSPAEERYLLQGCKDSRMACLHAFVRLALATAMRRSELLALRWHDIDRKQRVARLRTTKNGDARDVPLSPEALSALRALPRQIDDTRVFTVTANNVSQVFRAACLRGREAYLRDCAEKGKQADARFLADLRLHDLRHEATSRLFERGLALAEVAAITGHKTWQMLKRYTHLRAEDLARKLA